MRTFWAKPDQTYEEHVEAVYASWAKTVRALSPLVRRMGAKFGFSEDALLQRSLLSIVLHDIGKITEPFQRMMSAIRTGKKFDFTENYRHELASFPFIMMGSCLLMQTNPLVGNLPLEALAVVAHHKRLNTDLSSFERERLTKNIVYFEDGLRMAIDLASDIFNHEGYKFPDIKVELYKNDPYKKLSEFLSEPFAKLLHETNIDASRSTYALLKGILHYADWLGSGKEQLNYDVDTSQDAFLVDIGKWCAAKNIEFSGLRPFQRECSTTTGHVIAVAPTGSGKTEAALLWGLHNLREMGGGKLIYLLPTMVTANSIFQRLEGYFGSGNVGLTHSTASFMFEDEDDNSSGEALKDKRNFLFDKTFIRPATVATIDQLLTSGFNTGKWTLLETNAANAVIIIDEVHAYEHWTLGLIRETLKHFSSIGARFMLMSATLPDALIDLMKNTLPNARVVRDDTLLKACRSRYHVKNVLIEERLDLIEDVVNKGRKTLVVVNNVKSCQDIFMQLQHLNPICYHSKFILKDRFKKEQEINQAHLVIATQVVEVSLDIDFDIMFTECAPPDAIAQRAGRINRRRVKTDSHIFIFKYSDLSRKIYDPSADKLLERSFQAFAEAGEIITEADIIKIVENVYAGRKPDESPFFIEASAKYIETQRRLMGIFDNTIHEDRTEVARRVDYLQIPVIPTIFRGEVEGLPLSKRRWYEIKMPYWYVSKHKKEVSEVIFCDMNYDSDVGATFVADEEVASTII